MLVAALCAVAALTVGVPGAVARGVLDQTSLPALNEGLSVNDAFEHAQTFTAMRTGFLDTVALSFDQSDQDGRYIVDVVPTDAGGLPAGAPLASRTIDACRVQSSPLEIPFGPAASITAGTRYAIVVASQAGSTPTPSLVWDAGSPYAGGAAFSASPPGPNPAWNPAPFDDLAFSTYVSAAAPPSLARDATQTTVSSGKNPAPPGAVTFTASVTDPSHPGRVPTGTVAFRVANGLTFLQPLDAQGHASQAIDNLPKGATAITAAYCPDADGFESSSSSVNQTIAQDTTETTELANPQAIRVGETTTLTATVKDIDAPGKTPTGTVQFSDSGGQLIGPPVALQSGSATLATSAIPFGLHNIFASYSSSDGFLGPSTRNCPGRRHAVDQRDCLCRATRPCGCRAARHPRG